MRLYFTFLFALLSMGYTFGQTTPGCTAPCANNYNPNADVDDCSCILPEEPITECWQTASINPPTCQWEVTGNPPVEPALECWSTATFDENICDWIVTGEQPEAPETECDQSAIFNDITCQWEVFDSGFPEAEDDSCAFTIDSLDIATCTTIHTPNCPVGTVFDAEDCECLPNAIFGCTDLCGTNYNPDANIDDGSCTLPEEPIVACYEVECIFFDTTLCQWQISSCDPIYPDLECYQYAIYNMDLCDWEIFDGDFPSPDDGCELTDDFLFECTCELVNISTCPENTLLDAENCECLIYGELQYFTFFDANQNQIQDSDEPLLGDIPLLISPDSLSIYGNNNNIYLLDTGNYVVTIDLGTEWLITTDSASYFTTINAGETSSVYFGLYPSELISDLLTTVNLPWLRCHEEVIVDITTKNIGTTVATGTTWLQMDTAIIDFSFINEPDIIDNNTTPTNYGWNFTNLYPSQSITSQISILVPGPPDFTPGDYLFFETFTEYTDDNGDTAEALTFADEVRCSYDPNDKLVNPNRPYDEVLFGEDFVYTIRFQNTGNDVAYDVTILDTLDTNLDWETFRVLGSSHSEVLNTSLDNEGIITFDFQNIFLPDSTANLEGSNGYVTYMMSALDGLAESTVIRNSAGIYFDQNPPILTNTTESVMVSMLTTATTTPDDLFPDLAILPNPNTGTFQVEGIPRGTYHLLNTKGQLIQSGKLESGTLIDISAAAQGVYFIQMMVDEQIVTRRVVKL